METKERIKKSLEDLLKIEDVQACFVTGRQIGTVTPESKAKLKNLALWKLIMDTTHKFFPITEDFYMYGLSRLYFELKDYEIIMTFIGHGIALITIIPVLANRGLIEVEIENTSRIIKEILKLHK